MNCMQKLKYIGVLLLLSCSPISGVWADDAPAAGNTITPQSTEVKEQQQQVRTQLPTSAAAAPTVFHLPDGSGVVVNGVFYPSAQTQQMRMQEQQLDLQQQQLVAQQKQADQMQTMVKQQRKDQRRMRALMGQGLIPTLIQKWQDDRTP
jgi:hypothetical protein